MSGKNKVFKGISTQTVITGAMGILEVVYFAFMSRLLSKTDFGYFASITAVIAIAYSISEAGLGSAIIQKKETNKQHISTAFTLAILSGSLFSILLFCLAPVLSRLISDGGITIPLRIMSSILLINSLNSIANGLLSRSLSFKKIGILQICAYSISIVGAIYMAYRGFGVYALVLNAVSYPLILCIGYFTLGVKLPAFGIYRDHLKSILNYGGWLTAGVIVNNISHQVDKLLLPRLLSVQALGSYNRPAGFVSTVSSKINSIFDTVLFPILSKYQDDKENVRKIYIRASDLLNVFSILLASVFIFNARLIIEIFFGKEWLDLTFILQIVAISVIFNINSRLADCFFRSLNFVKNSFYIRFIILIITIICIIFGSKFGILGISIALVISNVVGIFMKVIVLCNKLRLFPFILFKYWIKAWKIMLPYIVVYFIFESYMQTSLMNDIWFALLFAIITMIQYMFFPKYIGEEYYQSIHPLLKKLIRKKNEINR